MMFDFFKNHFCCAVLIYLCFFCNALWCATKNANISIDKNSVSIRFGGHIPFALFKWKGRTWLGLPSGTLPQTLPNGNKNFTLQRVQVDGGDLLCALASNEDAVFPALKRKNGQIEVIITPKPKHIDLTPKFLSNSLLKRKNRQNIEIEFDTNNRLIMTQPNGNPAFVLLTSRYYTGMGARTRYVEFSLEPTMQGLLIVGNRPELTLTPRGMMLFDGFKPWTTGSPKEPPPSFSFDAILAKNPYTNPLAEKARKAFLSGHMDAALRSIVKLEHMHTSLNENQDFKALKGLVLAFQGCSSGACACFGFSPSLWKASQMFRGVSYMTSGEYEEGVKRLDTYFSAIKKLPDALQKRMFFLGAEGALLLGRQKKAQFFLSTLKTKKLSDEQKSLLSILENSTLTDSTFIERQISGASAASIAWQTYHMQVRKKLQNILLRQETKVATLPQTLVALEKLSQEGRGGVVEFEVLEKLVSFYEQAADYAHAIKTYEKLLRYLPIDDPKRPVFLNKAQDLYIKALYTKDWSVLKRCGFFKQYKKFLPQDKRGEEVLSTFTMMFLDKGFVDHIVPILFKSLKNDPEQKAQLLLACVHVYLNSERATEALLILDKNKNCPRSYQDAWSLSKAHALSLLGRNRNALDFLHDVPDTPEKAEIELKIYNALNDREHASQTLRYLIETTQKPDYVDQLGIDLYQDNNLQAFTPFLKAKNIPPTPFVELLLSKSSGVLPKTIEALKKQFKAYEQFKRYAAQVS